MFAAPPKPLVLALLTVFAHGGIAGFNVARADYSSSSEWFSAKPEDDRAIFQAALILLGHYNGLVDAVFGKNTYQAIVDYERSKGLAADGVLNRQEEERMLAASYLVYQDLGFTSEIDARANIRLPIPSALFARSEPAKWGTRWQSADSSIEMETLAIPETDTVFPALFRRLSNAGGRKVEYSVFKDDFVTDLTKPDVSDRSGRTRAVQSWSCDETSTGVRRRPSADLRKLEISNRKQAS